MIALRCQNIKKSFGSVVALSNATLSVEKGEIRALLGGNGSGKSTLARILGGAIKPDEGQIELYEKPCALRSPAYSKRQGIVITSQELSLFTNLSVEMNLLMCNIPKRLGLFTDHKELREKALFILKEMQLDHLLGKKVSDLSPNQQYLIEFAKALIQKPKILIVDEITSALYREEVEIVKTMLRYLKNEGASVLFISHRMSEIYSICDSVTVMRNGETIETVGIEEKDQNELLSMMSGREVVDKFPLIHSIENESNISEHPVLSVPELYLTQFKTRIKLDIRPGEFVGIAGLQGHGQSDLVRTLFGMKGTVNLYINGVKKHIASPRHAVNEGLAFISGDREHEGVFAGRSLSENLSAVKKLVMKQKNIDEKQLLHEYGVKFDTPKQPIKTLSGGNQQKVVIGRWIITKPLILLADDPTKGIDVQARLDVHRIMCDLIKEGSSVIFVSSDDEELVQLSRMAPMSRILVMYEGEIVRILSGSEISTENIVSASILRGA
ncbi:sugar ABC transporter ATP-binding protein [Collibacillus ludicampi]|uniref:Sugar ABC transporter ATP-binding protein n=1 Tax=Collibacillus ludicampi TaxID=2771369 RepID=A0AAV4LCH4_9BACL|nr:sugar ABC transporter ATP-binding protein [Collibacillus ludicampi]GIM45520.1 sugar ABC transporter ATP-binding protein [Collibacillus ludicampi]